MKRKHVHKVTLNERRRTNKRRNDLLSKRASGGDLKSVFDAYYRGPLKALYRKIIRG
jgi:hypothetical protein